MFKHGIIGIYTGNDDLREDSRVWVRFFIFDSVSGNINPRIIEVAGGNRFGDRTLNFIPFTFNSSVNITDVERIEVAFDPDGNDQWLFAGITITVLTTTGWNTLYHELTIARKFDRAGAWSSGTLPTYSNLTDSIIHVTDDYDQRVVDAEVFIGGNLVGVTDANGQMHVNPSILGRFPLDIVVRKLIHQQEYYRSNHNVDANENWNYRVYLTNVTIDNFGAASSIHAMSSTPSFIQTSISRNNTLIGLNLLVSVEWDLNNSDFAEIEQKIIDCSNFLYNATDGQFFIEHAQIADQSDYWDDSDFRVIADNSYRANVPNVVGGFLGWNACGSAMKMSRANSASTYAHEFGHFGFALGDEYADNDNSISCTSNVDVLGSLFASGQGRASCMMWHQWEAPKICSHLPDNPHVKGTRQGDESCWHTIKRRYNENANGRWNIRSPLDRWHIPAEIHVAGSGHPVRHQFMSTIIHDVTRPNLANLLQNPLTVTVKERAGPAIAGAKLKTFEVKTGRWIDQGRTNSLGDLTLAGVHENDIIRLETGVFVAQSPPVSATMSSFVFEITS